MNIRLTPKGLSALKTLAGEAGMRPGELVTKWVEERLEAERSGSTGFTGPDTSGSGVVQPGLEARVNELASRIAALEARSGGGHGTASVATDGPPAPGSTEPEAAPASPDPTAEAERGEAEPAAPRRRGRPPKAAAAASGAEAPKRPRGRPPTASPAGSGERRVPLHQEIIAVITEQGPMTAADLATAITARGIFQPPRSGKPLDAATVNSRVSNPVYRARFVRDGHRIALAEG